MSEGVIILWLCGILVVVTLVTIFILWYICPMSSELLQRWWMGRR